MSKLNTDNIIIVNDNNKILDKLPNKQNKYITINQEITISKDIIISKEITKSQDITRSQEHGFTFEQFNSDLSLLNGASIESQRKAFYG